jgi:hypothetical protein
MQIKGRRETRTLAHSIQRVGAARPPQRQPWSAHENEDAMTLNIDIASPFEFIGDEAVSTTPAVASEPVNTERRDAILFFIGFFALVGGMLLTAATVGLAGVGMIAIIQAAAMLVICLLLTAG